METLRNLSKLVFVVLVGVSCGVGCIAETDLETVDEAESLELDGEGSEGEVDTASENDDEEANAGTANDSGVCPPPCTKI